MLLRLFTIADIPYDYPSRTGGWECHGAVSIFSLFTALDCNSSNKTAENSPEFSRVKIAMSMKPKSNGLILFVCLENKSHPSPTEKGSALRGLSGINLLIVSYIDRSSYSTVTHAKTFVFEQMWFVENLPPEFPLIISVNLKKETKNVILFFFDG